MNSRKRTRAPESKIGRIGLDQNIYLAIRPSKVIQVLARCIGGCLGRGICVILLDNERAQGGVIIADARLHQRGMRFDDEVFMMMYGINFFSEHSNPLSDSSV